MAQANGAHKPEGPETRLIRLTGEERQFPLLWLQLSHRARKLWMRYAPYVPADRVLEDWCSKLLDPHMLAFAVWLVVDESERVVGHFVLEVVAYYTQSFVMGHQLQVDSPAVVRRHKEEGMEAIVSWVKGMNQVLAEAGSPARLKYMRLITPHSERVWRKWLPLELVLAEHTLTFDLGSEVAVDEEVNKD